MQTIGSDRKNKLRRITIVGGGTAGWLSALLLEQNHGERRFGPHGATITLIESPNTPTVGVGEATVPSMPSLLQYCGLSETEFFRHCNASFKLGVRFDGWNVDAAGKPIDYYNSFGGVPTIGNSQVADYFLKFGGYGLEYTQTLHLAPDLIAHHKGPRPLNSAPFAPMNDYAYHLDAGLFAGFLKKICVKRGVRHVLDDVTDIHQDEDGNITELSLKEGSIEPVDLVIDCTGFRGVIINQLLNEPFLDYSKYLANDRALALQIPHPDPNQIEPVTRSAAKSAGWCWRVPLKNRVGTGYVFSSSHLSDDEATTEFLDHIGMSDEDVAPKVIPVRVGRTRRQWVKNCVAIGLSGGFIEPLESTAIHMIATAVHWLSRNIPTRDMPNTLRDRYNQTMADLYDEVLDFICIHYRLGNRNDTQYWIDAREALDIPDRLRENIDVWKYRLPEMQDLHSSTLFTNHTYTKVLLGKQSYQNGFGKGTFATPASLQEDHWKAYLQKVRKEANFFVAQNANHAQLIKELSGELRQMGALSGFARR